MRGITILYASGWVSECDWLSAGDKTRVPVACQVRLLNIKKNSTPTDTFVSVTSVPQKKDLMADARAESRLA